ncbi:MAG: class I SAM-dependent methyltransferase [Isosphaeraceae bacterium]|nr:class I SAM-dependent methyltransferase [Isosphaeraceae bacterium]
MGCADLDRFADAYDESFPYALDNRLMLNWYAARVLELARGGALLELGIGHGYTTAAFSEAFERHVVLEGSPEIIARFKAKFRAARAEIVQTAFEDYQTNERFDLIVMGFVLEHVADPWLVLARFRGFLKEGGRLIVTVPNAEALNKRFGHAAGLVSSLTDLSDFDRALGHHRLFTVATLTDLVRSAGYRVERTEGIFLKPITTAQLTQLQLSEAILQAMLKVGIDYPELCVGLLAEAEA